MSIHRTRRISARTAEDLLNGTDVDARYVRLAAVLHAAAGPTRPGELAGRQRAVTAFHCARRNPAPFPRRQAMRTALLKLLTVKAAVVGAVVVGTGGVALAASTGALPNPLHSHPVPAASADKSHPGGRPAASDDPGNADPSPSLVGLCHAYTAGAGSEHGKALDSPAFQALLTAAGGKANVDGFCTKLLASAAAHPDGAPSGHPDGKPSDLPTGHPTEHPTGRPSEHPTGAPAPHPSH
jgi:hypothetical protein